MKLHLIGGLLVFLFVNQGIAGGGGGSPGPVCGEIVRTVMTRQQINDRQGRPGSYEFIHQARNCTQLGKTYVSRLLSLEYSLPSFIVSDSSKFESRNSTIFVALVTDWQGRTLFPTTAVGVVIGEKYHVTIAALVDDAGSALDKLPEKFSLRGLEIRTISEGYPAHSVKHLP